MNRLWKLLLCCAFGITLAGSIRAADASPKTKLYPVDKDGKWGYINTKGKVVIPFQFDEANYFSEGLAVVKVGEKFGFINERGKAVIAPRFESADQFPEDLAPIEEYKIGRLKTGFIDKTGEIVLDFFPSSYRCDIFQGGLAEVHIPFAGKGRGGQHTGLIDKSGKLIIKPDGRSQLGPFGDGLRAASLFSDTSQMRGKWGFMDNTGKMVIAQRFDRVFGFSENMAAVVENGKTFFIDKTGARVFPTDYEFAWGFSGGLAAVKIGGKWGYINKTGAIIIKPQFDYANIFSSGRAGFEIEHKWGFIDKTGKVIVPAIYGFCVPFIGELAQVGFDQGAVYGSGRGYINRDVKVIWAPRPKTTIVEKQP